MLTQKIFKDRHVDKGNRGMYVLAAGKPTQSSYDVRAYLQNYQLEDEVNALLSDAIIPPPPPRELAPICIPVIPDHRHAGLNNELKNLLNPPVPTRFEDLVTDFKSSVYKSFWRTPLAEAPDPRPMFPKGFDIKNTTFGKKNPVEGPLYDVIMPKNPLPDETPKSEALLAQMDRNYCRPAFNPDLTFGHKYKVDRRGWRTKSTMTDIKSVDGTAGRSVMSALEVDIRNDTEPTMGKALCPNNYINRVPKGHSFGIVSAPLGMCHRESYVVNQKLLQFRERLAHLNTLRSRNSKRFTPSFFKNLYLVLSHEDVDKKGWIPKNKLYYHCEKRRIVFDPSLIEPLLYAWEVFDGSSIEYKTFIQVINHTQPLPDLPYLSELYSDCADYPTTYREAYLQKRDAIDERPRAGLPSGRYMDLDYPVTPRNYCKATSLCLPHESDMVSCLNPSIFTLMHVSHRDMYARREPAVVRRVFEAAGEEFTDENFNKVWEEAKKHHSQGWVSFETFRRALDSLFPLI
ncbi:hypothetical protein O0L34_g7875 [Tuta absoluta]|nr:hypothetical protein O0L34_g7875 [Tuta absoluta]